MGLLRFVWNGDVADCVDDEDDGDDERDYAKDFCDDAKMTVTPGSFPEVVDVLADEGVMIGVASPDFVADGDAVLTPGVGVASEDSLPFVPAFPEEEVE